MDINFSSIPFGVTAGVLAPLKRHQWVKLLTSARCGSSRRCIAKGLRRSLNLRSVIPSGRRLKPASATIPTPSAKEENKQDDDEKCLGIHDPRAFQRLDAVSASFAATQAALSHLSQALNRRGRQPRKLLKEDLRGRSHAERQGHNGQQASSAVGGVEPICKVVPILRRFIALTRRCPDRARIGLAKLRRARVRAIFRGALAMVRTASIGKLVRAVVSRSNSSGDTPAMVLIAFPAVGLPAKRHG